MGNRGVGACGVHVSTGLQDANQSIAVADDGNDLARAAKSSHDASNSTLGGHSMKRWGMVTSLCTRWHAVCRFLRVMENMQPCTREPVAQETGPMARTRELTLLDVIQAVSEVAENEQEVIGTVVHLIRSGQVRLCDEAIEAIRQFVASMDAAA
jgi:hypothetical protein